MLDFFAHPYYYSSSLLAKLSINLASVLWSLIILLAPVPAREVVIPSRLRELTAATAASLNMHPWSLETMIAVFLFLMCSLLLWRLLSKKHPIWIGGVAYLLLSLFWVYGAAAIWTLDTPTPAGAAAAITTVAGLSIFALVANPKHGCS